VAEVTATPSAQTTNPATVAPELVLHDGFTAKTAPSPDVDELLEKLNAAPIPQAAWPKANQ